MRSRVRLLVSANWKKKSSAPLAIFSVDALIALSTWMRKVFDELIAAHVVEIRRWDAHRNRFIQSGVRSMIRDSARSYSIEAMPRWEFIEKIVVCGFFFSKSIAKLSLVANTIWCILARLTNSADVKWYFINEVEPKWNCSLGNSCSSMHTFVIALQ